MIKKILQVIAILAVAYMVLSPFILRWIESTVTTKATTSTGQQLPQASVKNKMTPESLLKATNKERVKRGISKLALNKTLNLSAGLKCNDMVQRDYWSHDAPDGTTPWSFFEKAGANYQVAAENLARGFETSSGTVKGWMDSEAHRRTLLDSMYGNVGFGICNSDNFVNDGESTIMVQHFTD